jgi:methionyl-tRNA synthetase
MQKKGFYATTPIYYVTAKPHLGSLYSTIIADVMTRWNRLKGCQTYMLTGTDEHGQKVFQAATQAGKDPKSFVDSFIASYYDTWQKYEIAYNHFIRTTDAAHIAAVQEWIRQLQAKGDIYKAVYEGWYCTPCETFVTETEINEQRAAGIEQPHCPNCGRPVQAMQEETYFFRLSAYQDRLLAYYAEHPDFIIPRERAHEVVQFVKSGLKDLSISRKTVTWGIPFPGDEHHVTYVWADALNNYITAIGWGKKGKEAEFKHWWPADVQVMGKDIIRFHAVYWPAFLMAIDLPLPRHLLVHGWIKVNQQKMSKSLGNVVDPVALYNDYGADAVRYYLMRHMAITHDGEFSIADLEQAITAELANDLGNLLNRVISLAEKHDALKLNDPRLWSPTALDLIEQAWQTIEAVQEYMDELMIHMAIARLWKFVNQVNAYFHAHEPWKLAKTDHKQFIEVIAVACHSLYVVGVLAWPIMPYKMQELLAALGCTLDLEREHNILEDISLSYHQRTFTLTKGAPLFVKPEPKEASVEEPQHEPAYIAIDDVAKVELIVGTITHAEQVPKSDKLLKLQVDFGPLGVRQVLAGVRQSYEPAELQGQQALFVGNLKPRMMLGHESQGMLLVAKDTEGKAIIMRPLVAVPNGSRLA